MLCDALMRPWDRSPARASEGGAPGTTDRDDLEAAIDLYRELRVDGAATVAAGRCHDEHVHPPAPRVARRRGQLHAEVHSPVCRFADDRDRRELVSARLPGGRFSTTSKKWLSPGPGATVIGTSIVTVVTPGAQACDTTADECAR